jgi:hypothetical protein
MIRKWTTGNREILKVCTSNDQNRQDYEMIHESSRDSPSASNEASVCSASSKAYQKFAE